MSNDKDFDELESLLREIEASDDFDIDSTRPKEDDRNPITKTIKQVAGSAFSATFPEGRRREIVSKALPDAYSEANDRFREIEFSAKNLYTHTKAELLETKREIQRKAASMAPSITKYMPAGMGKRFEAWASEGADRNDGGWWEEDRTDAEVGDALSQVFGQKQQPVNNYYYNQSGDTPSDDPKVVAEEEIKEFSKDLRQQSMEESLVNIRNQIDRIANNELSINTGWRRKSLEVGLRQLFALNDILKITKESNERIVPAIESVVKNTALPDYAKENVDEIALAMTKRRLIESVNPAEYARSFISDFTGKASKRISDIFSELRGGMDVSDMTDTFGGMEGIVSEQEMEDLKKQLGIDIVTSEFVERYINPRRDKILGTIKEKTKEMPFIKEIGERFKYYTKNISSIYNTELTDETSDSVFKDIVGYLGEIKEGYNGEELKLKDRTEDFLEGNAVFNQRYYLTQTEIIPAYLKSIDKAAWKIATGEDRDVTYDLGERGFVTDDEFNQRVIKQVMVPAQKKLYDAGLDKLVREFDSEGEISDEGREELKEYFHERIIKDRTFDMGELTRDDSLNEVLSDWDDADVFKEIMERKIEEEGKFGAMNQYADRFQRLRSLAGGYQREINRAALMYGDKALIDSGLFTGNGYGGASAKPEIIDYVSKVSMTDDDFKRNIDAVMSGRPKAQPTNVNEEGLNAVERKIVNNYSVDNSTVESTLSEMLEAIRGINLTPATGQYSSTTFDVSSIVERLDNIKDAIKDSSVGSETDRYTEVIELIGKSNENTTGILQAIETIRDSGIATVGLPTEEAKESVFKRGKKWLRSLPKRFVKGSARGGWIATKWTSRKLWRGGKRLVKGAFGGAKDVFNEEGEKILSGVKLKAGKYYTMTKEGIKKRIFSVDEIEDTVLDENGNEVLSEEDTQNADKFRLMRKGRIRKLSEFLRKKGGEAASAISGFGGRRVDNLIHAKNLTKDYLFNIPDVYVEGEDKPRLRGDLIKEGHYFADGKVIKKVRDIHGEIRDKNDKVIITDEEFAKEGFKLVDEKGRPINTRAGRILANTEKNFRDVIGLGRKSKDFVVDNVKSLYGKLRNRFSKEGEEDEVEDGEAKEGFLKRLFNRTAEITETARSYDILVKIYNLLNKRLPGEPGEDLPEREGLNYNSIKGKFSKKFKDAKNKAKEKYEEASKSNAADKVRAKKKEFEEKAKEKYSENKSKGRWARRRFNKTKRTLFEKADRSRRAAQIKAIRARRNLKTDIDKDGVTKVIRSRIQDNVTKPFKEKFDTAKAKIKEQLIGIDDPTDKFKRSKIKIGANDPQMLLLKRIADATEANWVRGLTLDTEEDGDLRSGQMLNNRFARRFKGVLSNIYRRGSDAKKDIKERYTNSRKAKEEGGEGKGVLGSLLSGFGGLLSKGLSSLTGMLGAGAGGGLLGGLLGNLLGNPKETIKKGAKNVAKSIAKNAGKFLTGRALWSAGAYVLGGIGTIVSAPVALTAAVLGGLTYAAYKHFSRVDPSEPGKVRFAQYGTRDYDNWDEDDAVKCIYLEEELNKFCTKKEDGSYVIRGMNKEIVNGLAEGYGVDITSEKEATAFGLYLVERFIPLYLLWRSRTNQLEFKGTLQEYEEKLPSAKEQLKLVDLTRLSPVHPIFAKRDDPDRADRGLIMSVSDWVGFTDRTLMNGDEVADVTARAIKELERKVAKEEKLKKDKKNREAGAVKFNRGIAAQTEDSKFTKAANSEKGKKALEAMYGGDNKKPKFQYGNAASVNAVEPDEDSNNASVVKIRGGVAPVFGNVSPTERLRFYLYGIEVVSQEDADCLRRLELIASNWVNHKTSTVDSSFYSLALAELPNFGKIAEARYGDSYESKMTAWLRDRFLPVYMGWYTSLSRVVGAGAVMAPTLSKQVYDCIYALLDLETPINGKMFNVVTLPGGVEIVGDFELIKDKLELSKIFAGFKPKDKSTKLNKPTGEKEGTVEGKTEKAESKADRGNRYIDRIMKKHEASRQKAIEQAKANGTYKETSTVTINGKVVSQSNDTGGSYKSNSVTGSFANSTPAIKGEGSGQYAEFANREVNSRGDVATLVGDIATAQGIDPDLMISTGLMESSLNPNAKASTSSAKGLFQFINGTWREMMAKHGNRLGIPSNVSPFDPVASTLLASEYFRGNSTYLPENRRGPVDLYMSHFMGAGGARKFLNALNRDPSTKGVKIDRNAANANPTIFFGKRGAKSLAEIYQGFAKKMMAHSSKISRLTDGKYKPTLTGAAVAIEKSEKRNKAIVNKANLDAANRENALESFNTTAPAYAATKKEPASNEKASLPKPPSIVKEEERSTRAQVPDPLSPASYLSTVSVKPRPSPLPDVEVVEPTPPPEPTPVVKQQTEVFERENPKASKEDVDTYEEALTNRERVKTKGSEALAEDTITRLINSNTTNTETVVAVLNNQVKHQANMVKLLQDISGKMTKLLEGKIDKRDLDRMEREDTDPLPYNVPVDMSPSKINITRNRNA